MTSGQSQERSQQEIASILRRIDGALQEQCKAMTLDESLVARKLHCDRHSLHQEDGYIQTDDGTQWEFRRGDAMSLDGRCILLQTSGHDGRGNDGHANIIIPLSRVVAIVTA